MTKEPNYLSCILKFVQMLEGILSVSLWSLYHLLSSTTSDIHKSGEQSMMNSPILITEIQQLLRFCHIFFIYMLFPLSHQIVLKQIPDCNTFQHIFLSFRQFISDWVRYLMSTYFCMTDTHFAFLIMWE